MDIFEYGTKRVVASVPGNSLRGCALHYKNLANADLAFADLTLCSFYSSNLACANLTGANLTHAGLSNTSLVGAILTNANKLLQCYSYWNMPRPTGKSKRVYGRVPGKTKEE